MSTRSISTGQSSEYLIVLKYVLAQLCFRSFDRILSIEVRYVLINAKKSDNECITDVRAYEKLQGVDVKSGIVAPHWWPGGIAVFRPHFLPPHDPLSLRRRRWLDGTDILLRFALPNLCAHTCVKLTLYLHIGGTMPSHDLLVILSLFDLNPLVRT